MRGKIKALFRNSKLIDILATFTILCSSEVVIIGANLKQLGILWGLIATIFLIFAIKNKKLNYPLYGIGLLLVVLILISMIVNKDYHGYSIWGSIVVACLFCSVIPSKKFFELYVKIMSGISAWSMIFFMIMVLFPDTLNYLPGYKYNERLLNFLFINIQKGSPRSDLRNYGVFAEPATFAIYLTVALAYCLLVSKEIKTECIIVLEITMISTRSMTGLVCLAILNLVYVSRVVLRYVHEKNFHKLFGVGIIVIILMVIYLIIDRMLGCDGISLTQRILYRFDINGPSRDSVLSRWKSVLYGFLIFKDNAIFGSGATKAYDEFLALDEIYPQYADCAKCWTNMPIYFLASFGFLFGLLFIVGTCLSVANETKDTLAIVVFGGTILLSYFGEILSYSLLTWILISYGYSYLIKTLEGKNGFNFLHII